jgi:hypothetical protein
MKKLLFILLLAANSASAQKWYTITKSDVLLITSSAISGTADGYNQAIIHHHYGQGNQFWDNDSSWMNKYKCKCNPNDRGGDASPAYPGSKTWLVWTTDGFHLTRMIDKTFTLVSIGITASEWNTFKGRQRALFIFKKILLSQLANKIAFNLSFNNLHR